MLCRYVSKEIENENEVQMLRREAMVKTSCVLIEGGSHSKKEPFESMNTHVNLESGRVLAREARICRNLACCRTANEVSAVTSMKRSGKSPKWLICRRIF